MKLKSYHRSYLSVSILSALGLMLPASVNAQDGERQSRSRLVEEVVVTAQKRAENAQDVPITIQAYSEEMLDALGVVNARDLQLVTPSLSFGEFVGYAIIYMRGVGTDAFLTADPSVTTYVDGVYLPFSFGQTADFGDIARIEVLKGPQGTLFGRNAVGGAIAVYTEDPSFEAFSASGSVSYARYSDVISKGTVNIPITDNFAVSLSGNYHENQFHYKGTYGQYKKDNIRPFGKEFAHGYRVKAFWEPSDKLDVMAAYAYNEFDGHGTGVTTVSQATDLTSVLASKPPENEYEANVDVGELGYYSELSYGRIQYFPGPVDMKLYASHQYTGNYQFYDFDGSADVTLAQFNSPTRDGSGADTTTAEFQILSNQETPWSDWFQWVAGAYYFDSLAGFREPAVLYLNVLDPLSATYDALDSILGGLLAPVSDLLGELPTGALGFTSQVATESLAGYFQTTFTLTDWMSLTLGGRYQVEERTVEESGTFAEQRDGSFINIFDRAKEIAETESFSPKISLEVRPVDGLMVYASYQEATKSGTFNAVNIYDGIDYVVPEEIKAFEVGAKTELVDGLRLNVAAWYYKQKNLQTQFVSLLKGGAVSFETAGAAESKGIEFDANWQVFPSVIDDLVLIASGAFVDAEYTDYADASGFAPGSGLLQENLDFTGNKVPQAAEFTGTLQLNKTFYFDSLNSSLELGGDFYYNDGFFWSAQNAESSREDEYTTLGARVSWYYEPAQLRVTAFGTNIMETDYNLQVFTSDFAVVEHQAKPAVYGLRVEMRYD